jgi:hypothetical protein
MQNLTEKISDKVGEMKGRLEITLADRSSPLAQAMERHIEYLRETGQKKLCGRWIKRFNSLFAVERWCVPNICVKVGRTMIINNLVDPSPDNAMVINYGAVGTNAAAPADADIKLGTEIARAVVASYNNSDNIGYITLFFGYAAANGTLKEAGLFSDATGVADTGILVSHAAINVVKSALNTLTIDWTLTLSDA